MTLYVFDGTNSPKRLILGPGVGTIEGGDYLFLSITGSSSFGGFISGSIPFADGNGNLTQDNNDFFWDNANKNLIVSGTIKAGIGIKVGPVGADPGVGEIFLSPTPAGTQIRIRQQTGFAANIQFWKDSTPSFADSIGNGIPGGTITNDLVLSTFNGSWTERGRFLNAGGLSVGDTNSWIRNFHYSIASGSATQLAADINGFVFIVAPQEWGMCIAFLRSGGHIVTIISDPLSIFSATSGTTNKINLYWSAGNSRYEIQNLRAASPETYDVLFFGNSV